MSIYRQLCILTFALLPVLCSGASVTLDGKTLVISGTLSVSDERSFFEPFETHAITTMRFENCQGGAYLPQEAIQRLIETHALATEAKGFVASGCALAFLAGFPRRLLPNGGVTDLAFHAPFSNETNRVMPELGDKLRDYLIRRTGGKVSGELAEMMIPLSDRQAWFHVFLQANMFEGKPFHVVFCQSDEAAGATCRPLLGLDAENLGLTTAEALDNGQIDR